MRGSPPAARRRKNVGCENNVQRVEHFGDAQILDLTEGRGEVAPEIAQDLAPVDLAIRDAVELLLEIGREVIFDITAEEGFKEGRDDAALVLGDQTLLFQPDIAAIAQHGEDGGIGRGAPDT